MHAPSPSSTSRPQPPASPSLAANGVTAQIMIKDFDLKALYSALDQKRSSRGLTWSSVGREIGERFVKVSPSTIKGVGERPRVEADGVLQMLLWLERSPPHKASGIQ